MVHRPQGFTFVYWFITKDIIKDTEKLPDKETCRTRSGRVPSAGQLLSQRSWDTPSSWHVDGLISASRTIRVLFMEALLLRHNWLLTPFPAPLWRLGGRAKNFFLILYVSGCLRSYCSAQALVYPSLSVAYGTLVPCRFLTTVPVGKFWGWKLKFLITVFLSDDQSLSKSHLIRTKDKVVIQEIPRDFGCLSGIRVKKQILEHKVLLVFLSHRKLQQFWTLWVRNWDQKLNVRTRVLWYLQQAVCQELGAGDQCICMSVFMSVSHYFDCCNFIVSFEIRRCESSIFVLLFQDYFWLFRVPWDSIWVWVLVFLFWHPKKRSLRFW